MYGAMQQRIIDIEVSNIEHAYMYANMDKLILNNMYANMDKFILKNEYHEELVITRRWLNAVIKSHNELGDWLHDDLELYERLEAIGTRLDVHDTAMQTELASHEDLEHHEKQVDGIKKRMPYCAVRRGKRNKKPRYAKRKRNE